MNINKCNSNTDSTLLEDPRLYREIIGNLLYLMTCTRPDICYAVSNLSQFLSKPTHEHLQMSKAVLRYIKGTKDYGLKFIKSIQSISLIGHCDSDWGSSSVDRKSISGYCFRVSENSSIISWRSKKQLTVALSTCEAEYMAATYAIQEGQFLRQVLSDVLMTPKLPVNLFVDNHQGAMELAKNPINHQRSKHIDMRIHFIRTEIASGNVTLHYVPSEQNVADIFAKPVSKFSFQKFKVCY